MSDSNLFNSFNESEYEEPSEQDATNAAVDSIVQSYTEEDVDEELAEAEKRLSKAAYYKQLVKGGVIEDDGTEEAQEINAEARLWARQRMANLLGLSATPTAQAPIVEPQFTDREAIALKKLAEKILLAQGEKPVDPVVKKIQPIAPPITKKVRIAAPPTKKPIQPTKANQPKKPLTVNKGTDYNTIPMNEVFNENGKLYKFVPHPDLDDQRLKVNVTRQATNAAAKPMPSSKAEWETVSATQANQNIDASGKNQLLQPLIAKSIQGE